jgi:hypothetical protein
MSLNEGRPEPNRLRVGLIAGQPRCQAGLSARRPAGQKHALAGACRSHHHRQALAGPCIQPSVQRRPGEQRCRQDGRTELRRREPYALSVSTLRTLAPTVITARSRLQRDSARKVSWLTFRHSSFSSPAIGACRCRGPEQFRPRVSQPNPCWASQSVLHGPPHQYSEPHGKITPKRVCGRLLLLDIQRSALPSTWQWTPATD